MKSIEAAQRRSGIRLSGARPRLRTRGVVAIQTDGGGQRLLAESDLKILP